MKRLLLAVICSMISCGAFAHGYQKDTVFYRDNNEKCHNAGQFVGHKDITLYELGGFNHGGMNKPGQQHLMNYIKSRINLVK